MTKEEKLEKIKTEYALYECPDIYSLRDSLFFMKDSQDYFDEVLSSVSAERRTSKLKKVVSKALGKRCREFEYMTPVDYDIDCGLLQLEEAVCIGSVCFFQRLFDAVNDDNVHSVSRLAQFTQDKCEDDIARIENYRRLARESNGYVAASLFEESLNFDSFGDFFDGAIKTASHVEKPQYTRGSYASGTNNE